MTTDIKHVFFDLDHTLWDFDKNSKLTFKKIFELNKIDMNLESFIQTYEPINLKYWKLYREERISKSKLRYGRLKDTFDAFDISIDDVMTHKLSEDYIEHLITFNNLFEDTIEVLDYLSKKYQLHIITNGFDEAQDRKLINSDIKTYFKTITTSEMVGVKKPNPKIFKFALKSANAKAKKSIMIGDNVEADMEGAENVGMSVIHFDYKDENKESKYNSVTQLIELKKIPVKHTLC